MFVTGCGEMGKSFLIKTVKAFIQSSTARDVAVCGPTGISAFKINCLTTHHLLMLPVEHGKHTPLSDDTLKVVCDKLWKVILLVIDEVSMISNVTLLFIHFRLVEIFNTQTDEDGWFGKRNLLFLGDLLQLLHAFEHPIYTDVSEDIACNCTGSLSGGNKTIYI